jgi:hypothetical protein
MIPTSRTALALAGDALCFLLFAFLGLHNHDEGFTASSVLRAIGPFSVAWLAFATLTGLYAADWPRPVATVWKRVLYAWVPAWLIGFVARAIIFDRGLVPAFATISLLVLGALLVGWRSLAARRLWRTSAIS